MSRVSGAKILSVKTHWNTLGRPWTPQFFSQGLIIVTLSLLYVTKQLALVLISTVLKVKTVPLTENGVLPEQRFVGLHTLMCHAEREKTLSRASVINASGCGTCSATLENIQFDIFLFWHVCVVFFPYIYWPNNVQYFLMLNIFCIVIHLPTMRLALCFNCCICA